jgi:hypothetical protein
MIRSRTLLLLAALLLLAGGCSILETTGGRIVGSGTMASETRPLADVTGVKLASIGAVEVVVGTDQSIVIEAEDNLIPFITTEVSDGVLTIGTTDETSLEPTRTLHFTVTVGRVELAEISGAGTLSIEDPENDRIDLSVPGAGTISVSGEVDWLTASISGTGTVEAARLAADDVIVEVSGAGNATVWAVNSLDVTLSGAGNVSYWGEPQVDQTITGIGDLRSLGAR